MDAERLTAVMDNLTSQTVLGKLLAPVARALAQVRYTSKVSRQVLRFFKCCFQKSASQALYEAQLRPQLLAYL